MTKVIFKHHREAALAILNALPELPHKTAGFLGHMCVAQEPTERQLKWLDSVLKQKGFQPLNAGGAQ